MATSVVPHSVPRRERLYRRPGPWALLCSLRKRLSSAASRSFSSSARIRRICASLRSISSRAVSYMQEMLRCNVVLLIRRAVACAPTRVRVRVREERVAALPAKGQCGARELRGSSLNRGALGSKKSWLCGGQGSALE